MLKVERQKRILKIISENEIGTQEELAKALKDAGIVTTQATVSRDIRELRLRKRHISPGKQRYIAPETKPDIIDGQDSGSYIKVLASGIISMAAAGNLIVIKTYSGMAMAVGAAIDSMMIEGKLGCIAGDDTVFIAVGDASMTERVILELKGVTE